MSDKIRFQLDATDLQINAPDSSGTDVDLQANWITALSDGLQRWSSRITDRHLEQWSISVADLSRDQWIGFQDFFYKVALGPTRVFTYTHTDGVSYQARFVDNALTAHRGCSALWSTSFKIEILGQQVNGTSTSTTSTTTTIFQQVRTSTSSTTSTARPSTTTTVRPARTSTTTTGTSSTTTTPGGSTTTSTTTTLATCTGTCTIRFGAGAWHVVTSSCVGGGGCTCSLPVVTGFEFDGQNASSVCSR